MIGNELFNMKKSLLFGAAMLLCACTSPATAKEGLVPFEVAERGCLAEALLFEAGNQPLIGMIAVGEVIINRIKSEKYPDTVCDVVHEGPISKWHYKELNKKVPINTDVNFHITAMERVMTLEILSAQKPMKKSRRLLSTF